MRFKQTRLQWLLIRDTSILDAFWGKRVWNKSSLETYFVFPKPGRPYWRRILNRREASPHKRRLKCVTNISPRRLMAHLLHQMVHYRTTLRGSEQRSTTIARIIIHPHAMILNIKRRSSESCAMRYLLRVTLIKNGVSTKVLSKSNHTHGGEINRV